ncbi:MAG: restriction endonuclease subunit S, partial [Bacteroidales bacterium]|nr:restriction endonuclease subunit S [Bacteroidales bacterium]
SYPSLSEQEKIVDELDCLSGIIEKKKQQLKELDALAQSIFYEMFGDPVENDKGWEKKRLDEIGEIIAGSTPSTADETNWDGDINWVTPAELDVQLYYGETVRKITEKAAKSLTLMPVGTVLLSTRAPIGKIAITTVPMYCNQGFKNIICNECINNVFLYYYLMLTMDNIKALGRGATFKEVSKKNISEYKVIIPDLDKQKQFASKIESIETQNEQIAQSIKETETLFHSRMDYYFG